MAALSNGDRVTIHAQWLRDNKTTLGAVTKADLKAAVDAIDDWVESNASAFNTAIPQPARGQLTAAQKAHLLMVVVERRFAVS